MAAPTPYRLLTLNTLAFPKVRASSPPSVVVVRRAPAPPRRAPRDDL